MGYAKSQVQTEYRLVRESKNRQIICTLIITKYLIESGYYKVDKDHTQIDRVFFNPKDDNEAIMETGCSCNPFREIQEVRCTREEIIDRFKEGHDKLIRKENK